MCVGVGKGTSIGRSCFFFALGEGGREREIVQYSFRGHTEKGGWDEIVMNSVGAFKKWFGTEWSGLIKGRDLMDC